MHVMSCSQIIVWHVTLTPWSCACYVMFVGLSSMYDMGLSHDSQVHVTSISQLERCAKTSCYFCVHQNRAIMEVHKTANGGWFQAVNLAEIKLIPKPDTEIQNSDEWTTQVDLWLLKKLNWIWAEDKTKLILSPRLEQRLLDPPLFLACQCPHCNVSVILLSSLRSREAVFGWTCNLPSRHQQRSDLQFLSSKQPSAVTIQGISSFAEIWQKVRTQINEKTKQSVQ